MVHAINNASRSKIQWPTGKELVETQNDFFRLCGLPTVVGAIDGSHVGISKPRFGATDYYYYFKSGGYTLNCQAVVDSRKRFIDLFLGMFGSTNDSCMLWCSFLFEKAQHANLFDACFGVSGFSPYLLGDNGYPLLPWLMTPHSGRDHLPLEDTLYNRRLIQRWGVVENAFGILKQSFCELLTKSHLDVAFLPNVITCCCILHNVMLG